MGQVIVAGGIHEGAMRPGFLVKRVGDGVVLCLGAGLGFWGKDRPRHSRNHSPLPVLDRGECIPHPMDAARLVDGIEIPVLCRQRRA